MRTTSATGSTTPVSLLASITATTAVRSSTLARRSSRSTRPSARVRAASTGTPSSASALAVFITAWCSIVEYTTLRRGSRAAAAAPRSAVLSASVPLPVKTISPGEAPIRAATCSRAVSTAARACWPNQCRLDGLPKPSRRMGSIASSTRGSSGVVAL